MRYRGVEVIDSTAPPHNLLNLHNHLDRAFIISST